MQQLTKANENCAVQLHTVSHMHTHTHTHMHTHTLTPTRTPTLAAQVAKAEVEADAVASICQLKVERCGQVERKAVRHQGQQQGEAGRREAGEHGWQCECERIHIIYASLSICTKYE